MKFTNISGFFEPLTKQPRRGVGRAVWGSANISTPFAEVAAHIHIRFAFPQGLALIGVGLALTVGDFKLDQSGLEIHLDRNERAAFGRKLLVEFSDLPFVQQQTPGAFDFVVETVAETVNGNVNIVEKGLSVFNLDIAFS